MNKRGHSFLSISSKLQNFILPKLGGIRGNKINFNDFLTITPKIHIFSIFFYKGLIIILS